MWSYVGMKKISAPFTHVKAHLSRYGRMAEDGQTILVLKHKRSAFLIGPVPKEETDREKKPGLAADLIHMAPDFDATPEEIVREFEGTI